MTIFKGSEPMVVALGTSPTERLTFIAAVYHGSKKIYPYGKKEERTYSESGTIFAPWWATRAVLVGIGGGSGGSGGRNFGGTGGKSGTPGQWQGATIEVRPNEKFSFSVGQGGAGGGVPEGSGGDGTSTEVHRSSDNSLCLRASGGVFGTSNTNPGQFTFDGRTYQGGHVAGTSSNGTPPGGAGGAGKGGQIIIGGATAGGSGARGQLWVTFYSE